MARVAAQINSLMGKRKTEDVNLGILMSEFHCIDAIVGVEYEIYDQFGKLTGRVKRKPLAPEQIKELMEVLEETLRAKNAKGKHGR